MVFCFLAALRILIFASAFPLFNNIDEPAHFASIQMYSHGHWPGKDLPHYDSDTARLLALFASEEYLTPENKVETPGHHTPLYAMPPERLSNYLPAMMERVLADSNHEGQSAPLYYLLAAAWQHIGATLGMNTWQRAYWIRFMNAVGYGLLIWLSYRLVRKAYPDRLFLLLAVPALLAVFPQDVYFGMNRDVLSAPFSAAALWLMAEAVDERSTHVWPPIAASLMVGLAFLINVPNGVLYGPLAITIWFWMRQEVKPPAEKLRIVALAVLAALGPPAIWMIRNYSTGGDLTGARAKVEALGWSLKPPAMLFQHPLFSVHGLKYFIGELTTSFWRGEYVWHLERMHWPVADQVYVVSSALMLAVFMVCLWRDWKNSLFSSRFLAFQSMLLIFSSIAFMAVLSLLFDFGNKNSYPSREVPYFVSGRIIQCALPGFAIVYACGLEALLMPIRKWMPTVALAILMLFITVSEFSIRQVAFSSPYNFFALLSWKPGESALPSPADGTKLLLDLSVPLRACGAQSEARSRHPVD